MELKDQIRIARESSGMSQQQLAAMIMDGKGRPYTGQAVRDWEDGVHAPRLAALKQIEIVLGTRIFPTGEFPPGTAAYLSNMSEEDVEIARAISSMPKVIRHAIVTLVKSGSWYAISGAAPFSAHPPPKRAKHAIIYLGGESVESVTSPGTEAHTGTDSDSRVGSGDKRAEQSTN